MFRVLRASSGAGMRLPLLSRSVAPRRVPMPVRPLRGPRYGLSPRLVAAATGMMCPVRRPTVALAGLALLVAAVVADAGPGVAGGAADVAPTAVRTMLGPGVLAGPGGIALDAAGNLFVADTGHCRVLVVPARSGPFDGLRVRAGRAATLAGGSCTGPAAFGHPSDVAVDGRGNVLVAEATSQRVQEVRAGSRTVVTVAGTGTAGFNGDVAAATAGELDEPTGVAV